MAKHGPEHLRSKNKRLFDIVGGLALAGVLAPPAAAACLVSMVDTGSFNPFYMQERIGQYGVPFTMRKIRTLQKLDEGIPMQTYGTHDPRATRAGQFLRSTCIDESLQALNIIKGDMSLVGLRHM